MPKFTNLLIIILTLAIMLGVLYSQLYLKVPEKTKIEEKNHISKTIKPEFKLFGNDNKEFTEIDLKGKYSLLYFGQLSSPDLSHYILSFYKRLSMLTDGCCYLVYIDLEIKNNRESNYKEIIGDKILILHGNNEKIATIQKNFDITILPKNTENQFFPHTSLFYLMDKEFKLIKIFRDNQIEEIETEIRKLK